MLTVIQMVNGLNDLRELILILQNIMVSEIILYEIRPGIMFIHDVQYSFSISIITDFKKLKVL